MVAAGSQKEEWREVLCKALAREELSTCRKSIRRVLLQVCGGHSAYRDAKATYTLQDCPAGCVPGTLGLLNLHILFELHPDSAMLCQ